ncbi:VOC family protein [Bacillus sp. SA1-12]
MKISKLDHLVLTVKSIYKTCEYYSEVLGWRLSHLERAERHYTLESRK